VKALPKMAQALAAEPNIGLTTCDTGHPGHPDIPISQHHFKHGPSWKVILIFDSSDNNNHLRGLVACVGDGIFAI
jgi:hypothetical protein